MLKEKLQCGETVLGTMLSEVATPNVVRVLQAAGYDFVIIDCEHGYFDFSQVANLITAGNGFGIPMLIRIPAIERQYITKVLDMGADGLLVPMVSTREDAERVVAYAKYHPLGKRGISTTRPHTNYAPPPLHEYCEIANRRTLVLVQIETRLGAKNAAEIARVEGIDALMVGPNDLAADCGAPGELDTEAMKTAIRTIIAGAKEGGKASGIIESHVDFLHQWAREGMKVFSCNSEIGLLLQAARQTKKQFFRE